MAYEDEKKRYKKEFDKVYISEKSTKDEPRPFISEPKIYEDREKTEVKIVERKGMPRMEQQGAVSLERKTPEIIGSLFDRVDFLRERIGEISGILEERKKIHADMVKEIEDDIEEKEKLASVITNPDDRRNLKLDISILRKDRRTEVLQFWKDMLELQTELRELNEQFITESKIMGLFKNLGGEQ